MLGERSISPVTPLDELSRNIRRVTRIKNQGGKVTEGTKIIEDRVETQDFEYYDRLPLFAQRELKKAEESGSLARDDVERNAFDRCYMLVRDGEGGDWRFPTSDVLTDEGGSLRKVGERVVARLMNGFSDGGDVKGIKTEEEIRAELEALRITDSEDEGGMTLKEKRRKRKRLKEMKGSVEAEAGQKAKEEVPGYLEMIGNSPMGVMEMNGSRVYLMRCYVKDVHMVTVQDWGRLHEAIEENLGGGQVGWFTREEIVKGGMIKDEAGETERFLDLLLQD